MEQNFFRQEYVKTVIDVIKKKKYVTEIILFEETGKTSKGTIENTVDVSEIEINTLDRPAKEYIYTNEKTITLKEGKSKLIKIY